jgi:hypothetical protein
MSRLHWIVVCVVAVLAAGSAVFAFVLAVVFG